MQEEEIGAVPGGLLTVAGSLGRNPIMLPNRWSPFVPANYSNFKFSKTHAHKYIHSNLHINIIQVVSVLVCFVLSSSFNKTWPEPKMASVL